MNGDMANDHKNQVWTSSKKRHTFNHLLADIYDYSLANIVLKENYKGFS